MLWAWERPERISRLDNKIGVAFYAGTIYINNETYSFQPRSQPLEIPDSTYLEAVVRIENKVGAAPKLSDETMESLLKKLVSIAKRPGIKAIQIDYDAKENERPFYRNFLLKLRQALPWQYPVSITALASWCLGDNWLSNMPVAEIVPMFFDMGAGRKDILSYIKFAKLEKLSVLQKSIGFSMKESDIIDILRARLESSPQRIYFFSYRPWNTNAIETIQSEAQKWHTVAY
jgi:hypothetical protein